MTVAFAGHRPEGLPYDLASERGLRLRALLGRMIRERMEKGCGTFYCGAAMGVDILCGELVLELRQEGFAAKLVCVLPHWGQTARWTEEWRARHAALLAGADEVVCLSERSSRDCYYRRNRYMVDHSDEILAVYTGAGRGGTAYTLRYAARRGKARTVIDPTKV